MAGTQKVYGPGEDTEQETRTVLTTAARTKGDVVLVVNGETGPEDLTVASSASVRQQAGVHLYDADSGTRTVVVTRGPVQATVTSGSFTSGNGIEMDGANVEDSGGSYAGDVGEAATDFAIAMEDGTTVTTLKICLRGDPFTSTT